MRNPLCIGFLLAVCALPAAHAQRAPHPETLVRAWLASQRALGSDLTRVELRERSTWTLDGPFGTRRTRLLARVAGGVDPDGWARDPVAVEVDGRKASLRQWERLEEQRRAMMGEQAERAIRTVVQLHRVLGRLMPVGDTHREAVEGIRCWRVDLVPREDPAFLERYTLWFDQEQGHLIRSRAVVHTRHRDAPFLITTEYDRIEGFDVPRRRRMEGTLETRRRLRTYTVLFTYEASYDAYRFFRRP